MLFYTTLTSSLHNMNIMKERFYVSFCSVVLQAQTFEERLTELSSQLARSQLWGQQQLAALQSREDEVVVLKVEIASLRESYHSKVAQVSHMHACTHCRHARRIIC